MSNTTALVPHLFEGHRIRVSTDQQCEAWIVVADACAALAESPMVWAMVNRREEEHCLNSEEGPGAGGFSLALFNEAALLCRLLNSDNPSGPRMRRWLTHELLPALQRRQEGNGELPRRSIDAIRRQIAAEVLRGPKEIIHLTGVSDAFGGIVVSDRYSAYNHLPNQQRQLCWAHLIRDLTAIAERPGASR
jgi:prophage antirepressor-like protein